jgi:hypothetical protein
MDIDMIILRKQKSKSHPTIYLHSQLEALTLPVDANDTGGADKNLHSTGERI